MVHTGTARLPGVLLLTRFAIKQLWRIALNGGKKKAILRLEMRNYSH